MKKPASRILIINDEKLVLKEFIKGLNAIAKTLQNPFGIIYSVTAAHETLQPIDLDSDI